MVGSDDDYSEMVHDGFIFGDRSLGDKEALQEAIKMKYDQEEKGWSRHQRSIENEGDADDRTEDHRHKVSHGVEQPFA